MALLGAVGVRDVLAILERVGPLRFIGYAAYTLIVLSILGLGWRILVPGPELAGVGAGTFIWARTMREAATNLLPFSQFGGIIVGLRVLVRGGVPQPVAYASQVADQTAELAAQLVYTLYGVAALMLILNRTPDHGDLLRLAVVGLGVSVAVILAFAFAQRPMLAFAVRIGGAMLPGSIATLNVVRDRLDAIYRDRRRLIGSFLLHLIAWVAGGAGAAIILRFIGSDIPIESVIVIESLIFTLRTAAFLVPGGIGVQEGAYVLIGPLFGLPAEAALALSLAKRARDLMVDLPAILIWQFSEMRGALRAR
jgi:putative membrane protein